MEEERNADTHMKTERSMEGGWRKNRVLDVWHYRGHNSSQQTCSTQLKNDDASLTLSY